MSRKEYMPIDAIEKYILSNYPYRVLSITPIKFKDTDKQRAVYRFETDEGPKCLKKAYYDEANLLFVYSVIQWFYSRGINVPKLLPTKQGGRYVNYNGRLFIATDWIDGRKCDYDVDDDVCMAAANLGNMHKQSYSFHPIKGSYLRKDDANWHKTFNKRCLQLLQFYNMAASFKDRFSKIYLNNFDYYFSRAAHAVEVLSMIDPQKIAEPMEKYNTICHLDYVNKNLIIKDDSKVFVIDFDKSKIDIPIHDIGTFLKRILKRKSTSWSYDILTMTLKNYEKERELTIHELLWLFAYLEFPQKLWKISRDYYANRNECNKKMFINMLSSACSQQKNHDEFCSRFQSYIENRYHICLGQIKPI